MALWAFTSVSLRLRWVPLLVLLAVPLGLLPCMPHWGLTLVALGLGLEANGPWPNLKSQAPVTQEATGKPSHIDEVSPHTLTRQQVSPHYIDEA